MADLQGVWFIHYTIATTETRFNYRQQTLKHTGSYLDEQMADAVEVEGGRAGPAVVGLLPALQGPATLL